MWGGRKEDSGVTSGFGADNWMDSGRASRSEMIGQEARNQVLSDSKTPAEGRQPPPEPVGQGPQAVASSLPCSKSAGGMVTLVARTGCLRKGVGPESMTAPSSRGK